MRELIIFFHLVGPGMKLRWSGLESSLYPLGLPAGLQALLSVAQAFPSLEIIIANWSEKYDMDLFHSFNVGY